MTYQCVYGIKGKGKIKIKEKEDAVKTKRERYTKRGEKTDKKKKRKMLKGRNQNEIEAIQREQARWRAGPAPHLRCCLLPVTPRGGRDQAHACTLTGPATEPPCQCKRVSPGMGMSGLLSLPAVWDLQASEMQD